MRAPAVGAHALMRHRPVVRLDAVVRQALIKQEEVDFMGEVNLEALKSL